MAARAERERDAGATRPGAPRARVKTKEVEERAAAAEAERDAVRAECAREKETLLKQFDARIAGLRLEGSRRATTPRSSRRLSET